MKAAGAAALAFVLLHAVELRGYGELEDLLWACNVACVALGVGLIARRRELVAGGTLVLAVGLPLWVLGVATGERFMLTSVLVHAGGLALGVRGVARLGMPRGIWWKTLACHCALIPLARALGSPTRNVDLAFRIWPGFERAFGSWRGYIAFVIAAHGVAYGAIERLGERLWWRDPGPLDDGELELVLVERYPGDAARGFVPAYRFRMQRGGAAVGQIELRVGEGRDLVMYAGQLAYGVDEGHRGHRFAARACRLLVPLARRHGLAPLWITCNPENVASRRTCERAGAALVEVVDLPETSDMYQRGERRKCRYRLEVSELTSPRTS